MTYEQELWNAAEYAMFGGSDECDGYCDSCDDCDCPDNPNYKEEE